MAGICVDERRRLVHTLAKGSIVTWRVGDVETEELSEINVPARVGVSPTALCLHPSTLQVYVATSPAKKGDPVQIFLFGLTNQRLLSTFSGYHTQAITHLLWVDGCGLLSASLDGTCRLWDESGRDRIIYNTNRSRTFLGDVEVDKVKGVVVQGSWPVKVFVASEAGGIDMITLPPGIMEEPLEQKEVLPLWASRRLLFPGANDADIPPPAVPSYRWREFDKSACKVGDSVQVKDEVESKWEMAKVTCVDPFEVWPLSYGFCKNEPGEGLEFTYCRLPLDSAIEAKEKAAHEAYKKLKEEEPLCKKRKGDYDNSITALENVEEGVLVAATIAGEVILVWEHSHEALNVFSKSYAGQIVSKKVSLDLRLFAGNRGYDAPKYEIVIFSVQPFRELRRVQCPEMITGLYGSVAAGVLLVTADDKGVFSLSLDRDDELQTVFLGEEDPDTMNNEQVLGYAEAFGSIWMRTTFGRVRRFITNRPLKEDSDLKPEGQFGILGRASVCFDSESGMLLATRGGYDDFKIDTASFGDKSWVRLSSFPRIKSDGTTSGNDSQETLEILKDGEPEMGKGYPGKYRVKTNQGEELTVDLKELGGVMLLGKGWPPKLLDVLELPGRSMVVIGGELGGMIEYFPKTGSAIRFEGGKIQGGCCASRGPTSVCATWDSEGAVVVATCGQGPCVYDAVTRKHLGDLVCKTYRLAAVRGSGIDVARVAAWEDTEKSVMIYNVRKLTLVQKIQIEKGLLLSCIYSDCANRLFTSFCAKDEHEGRLAAWSVVAPTEEQDSVSSEVPMLDFGVTDKVTSMIVVSQVGLFMAHSVKKGISVRDPRSGQFLYRIAPADTGQNLYIKKGPGELCVMWYVNGGRVGLLRWNCLTMLKKGHAEKGIPKFTVREYIFFALDVYSFIVTVLQLLSFALAQVRVANDEGEVHTKGGIANRIPSPFLSFPVRSIAHFDFLTGASLPETTYVVQFLLAVIFVIFFIFIFYSQEFVQEKAYLRPRSKWNLAFEALEKIVEVSVQTAALPIFRILFVSFLCEGDGMQALVDERCLRGVHYLFILPAIPVLVMLCLLGFRVVRVGNNLANINAFANPFNIKYDYVGGFKEPKNLLSGMSATYGRFTYTLKYAYTCCDLLTEGTSNVILKVLLGTTQGIGSLFEDCAMPRPDEDWLQINKIKFAIDCGGFWIITCMCLAACVDSDVLPDGAWLDWTPVVIVPLFLAALLSRPLLRRTIVPLITPYVARFWRALRDCITPCALRLESLASRILRQLSSLLTRSKKRKSTTSQQREVPPDEPAVGNALEPEIKIDIIAGESQGQDLEETEDQDAPLVSKTATDASTVAKKKNMPKGKVSTTAKAKPKARGKSKIKKSVKPAESVGKV